MIKKFKKVNLVAEVGCNHMGDLSTAKKIDLGHMLLNIRKSIIFL